MTTIAAWVRKGVGTIAADSRVSGSETGYAFSSPKLFKAGKSVFGGAGDDWLDVFAAWAQAGRHGLPAQLSVRTQDVDFSIIELAPTGLWVWGPTFTRMKIDDAEFAVGTGQMVALYAMRYLGYDPRRAVKAAATVDSYTGGRIDVATVVLTQKRKSK